MVAVLAVAAVGLFGLTACEPQPPPSVASCFQHDNGSKWSNRDVYLKDRNGANVAMGQADINGCITFTFYGPANGYYRLQAYLAIRGGGGRVIGVWMSATAERYIGSTGHTYIPSPYVMYQPF